MKSLYIYIKARCKLLYLITVFALIFLAILSFTIYFVILSLYHDKPCNAIIVAIFDHPQSPGKYRIYHIRDKYVADNACRILMRHSPTDNWIGNCKYGVIWTIRDGVSEMTFMLRIGRTDSYGQHASNDETRGPDIFVFDCMYFMYTIDMAIARGEPNCSMVVSDTQPAEWTEPPK